MFKVGDWCIHDCKVVVIKEIRNDSCDVSDGMFRTGTSLVYLRPLTLMNKRIADMADRMYAEIHREAPSGLNFPGIFNKACSLSYDAMDAIEGSPKQAELIDKLAEFLKGVDLYVRSIKLNNVSGVRMWR